MKDNLLNKSYPEAFKSNAVEKLLSPNSGGITATANKIGIPVSTLSGWKTKYGTKSTMKNSKNKSINAWSSEEKLQALLDTVSMSENELGAYVRANGLYSSDLERFKKELSSSNSIKGRPKLDPETMELRKQNKSLEKDLRRTKSALAEQSARIILLKKSHEIWGVREEDE